MYSPTFCQMKASELLCYRRPITQKRHNGGKGSHHHAKCASRSWIDPDALPWSMVTAPLQSTNGRWTNRKICILCGSKSTSMMDMTLFGLISCFGLVTVRILVLVEVR